MEVQYSREIKFMEHLPIMVCLGDAEKDEIISLNGEGKRIIGEDYKNKRLSEVFGESKEFNEYILGKKAGATVNLTYGQLLNGRWLMMSICEFHPDGMEDMGNILVITGNDVTSLKRHGYFDSVSERDPQTGIYTKQAGINFLENYLYGLNNGEECFSLAYIRFEPDTDVLDEAELKAYTLGLIEVLKNVIRGTDIFASMDDTDYIIIFPKCTFEIVDNIMTTIDNRLEFINNTENRPYVYKINHAILEIDQPNTADRDTILNKIKALLG